MPAPVPQTRFNELLTEATSLLGASKPIDEFTIRRIEREAAVLRERRIDVSGGWELAGYCAAMRNDVAEVLACTRKAQGAPGADHLTLLRMANALLLINATAELRLLVAEAIAQNPDDTMTIAEGASLLGQSGYVLDATVLHASPDGVPLDEGMMREAFAAGTWSVEEVAAPIRFARTWLRAQGVEIEKTRSWAAKDEDGVYSVVFEMGVATEADSAIELETTMFEQLAGQEFAAEQAGFVVMMLFPSQDKGSVHRACLA